VWVRVLRPLASGSSVGLEEVGKEGFREARALIRHRKHKVDKLGLDIEAELAALGGFCVDGLARLARSTPRVAELLLQIRCLFRVSGFGFRVSGFSFRF
jgi:hypothetical protein